MKKWSIYTTWSILGAIAVGAAITTSIYYSKYKSLKNGMENKGIKVQIAMFDKIGNSTATKTEIYTVQKGEVTLADLMLHHPNDFHLSPSGDYGRSVESIYGVNAETKNHEFWELTSQTYLLSHPENLGIGNQVTKENGLNVGISNVVLTSPQIINFYLSTY